MEIVLTDYQKSLVKNRHFFERYSKWIAIYTNRPKPNDGEFHHIIPKCIGGDESEKNIIKLGYREHYIAHYILAKAFSFKGLWFAFNCMRRVCDSKSVLYEAARKHISLTISETNRGRKRSSKFKNMISERFSGKVLTKDLEGNRLLVNVNDFRYTSGELVYHRTGTKHKESTKKKISKNGLRGRSAYHTSDGTIAYFYDSDIKCGFTKGFPPDIISRQLENLRRPGRNLKLKKCPHCGTEGKGGNMTRYHFNNCKKYDEKRRNTKTN